MKKQQKAEEREKAKENIDLLQQLTAVFLTLVICSVLLHWL